MSFLNSVLMATIEGEEEVEEDKEGETEVEVEEEGEKLSDV